MRILVYNFQPQNVHLGSYKNSLLCGILHKEISLQYIPFRGDFTKRLNSIPKNSIVFYFANLNHLSYRNHLKFRILICFYIFTNKPYLLNIPEIIFYIMKFILYQNFRYEISIPTIYFVSQYSMTPSEINSTEFKQNFHDWNLFYIYYYQFFLNISEILFHKSFKMHLESHFRGCSQFNCL